MRRRIPLIVSALVLAAVSAIGLLHAGMWDSIKKGVDKAAGGLEKARTPRRTRTPKASAAVRGLDEDGEGAVDDRNYEDLDWIERFEIGDEELRRFIEEGRLSP